MRVVREARAKGSFVKGVYKETAPKEYMFNGGRNWAWGELHMPDAARMSGAARMLDVARTVCGWRVCGRRPTWESARCFAVCERWACGRRSLAARRLAFSRVNER